jgi:hypothetical protein
MPGFLLGPRRRPRQGPPRRAVARQRVKQGTLRVPLGRSVQPRPRPGEGAGIPRRDAPAGRRQARAFLCCTGMCECRERAGARSDLHVRPAFLCCTGMYECRESAWMRVAASMKITQEVRDYAASQKLSEEEALQKGMEAKAVEFVKQGAEIYKKA